MSWDNLGQSFGCIETETSDPSSVVLLSQTYLGNSVILFYGWDTNQLFFFCISIYKK